jgi:hypothetical protein
MPDLIVNTAARIEAFRSDGKVQFKVEAPIRGEGLRCTRISEDSQPEVVELLKRVGMGTEADLALLSEQDINCLKEFGILVLESSFSRTVHLDLTTRGSGGKDDPPQIRFQGPELHLPDVPLQTPDGGMVIWTRDSLRAVWFPHMLTPEQLQAVRRVMNGTSPWELGDGAGEELFRSGILDSSSNPLILRAIWERTLAVAGDQLDRNGYAVIPSLLPPYLLDVVKDYYRRSIAEGFLRLEDEHAVRYTAHREPLAEWLHQQIADILKPILSGRFKPSYSFVCAYTGGAELPRHTDRAQCEVTVSLCVDASPGAERWPLYLESAGGVMVESRLGIGHALVFKGRELPHSRNTLADGERFVTLLFHFVEVGFNGSLD